MLTSQADAVFNRAENALAGHEPLQAALDAIRELRRLCSQQGENQLAYQLWETERDVWSKLNPPRGGE